MYRGFLKGVGVRRGVSREGVLSMWGGVKRNMCVERGIYVCVMRCVKGGGC